MRWFLPKKCKMFCASKFRRYNASKGQAMSDDLEQTILDNAQAPAKASGDSGSMEQHPLPDQIAADRYLESKKAARRKGLGIGLKKLVPPGTD